MFATSFHELKEAGVPVTPREYLTLMALIERADNCLYAVKRQGRNRVISETDPEVEPPTNPESTPSAQVA